MADYLQRILDSAVAEHKKGNPTRAGELYQRILRENPTHAGALHFSGLLAHQSGQHEVALELMQRSVRAQPGVPDYFNNLGLVLNALRRNDDAIAAFQKSLSLKPTFLPALVNLGLTLKNLNRPAEAADVLQRGVAIQPDDADLHNSLGECLLANRDYAAAADHLERASQLRPDFCAALSNLGAAYGWMGRTDDSLRVLRQAITINPTFPEARSNYGKTLSLLDRYDEALEQLTCAAQLRPDWAPAHTNLGVVHERMGKIDDSLASCRRAVELDPEFGAAHFNLACVLLLSGNYTEGWAEFEWRWRSPDFTSPRRLFDRPQWDGSDPKGVSILIHAEQGMGDVIQFIRYAPMLAERGARVLVGCHSALKPVIQRVPGIERVFAGDDVAGGFDVHIPIMSLPHAFETTVETIPRNVPYITVDRALTERWAKFLGPRSGKLRVGVVWAGRPTHANDRFRSMPFENLSQLSGIRDIRWVSLQKTWDGDVKSRPAGLDWVDLTDHLDNYAETAALINELDLVISVDTSVAHLAGAMGKPTWILLAAAPDYRWMLGRSDSPWYPSVRLFRQKRLYDWKPVMDEVASALARLLSNSRFSA